MLSNNTILVIGKNAKTGSRVSHRLSDLGQAYRPVSRSSTPSFDWQLPSTWKTALSGCKSAYVTFQPDLAIPSALSTIEQFLDHAKQAGLEHIVLLSGRGEKGAENAEQALINCGLDWNVVRASWFNQNFSESFMLDGILAGELVLPEANTLEPFVDADDIADVAVAALTKPELRNRIFEVTGPALISFADCVQQLSTTLNYPIKLSQIPLQDYLQNLSAQGVPEDFQWLINELFSQVLDGRNAKLGDGIQKALNREPKSFEQFTKNALALGKFKQNKVS